MQLSFHESKYQIDYQSLEIKLISTQAMKSSKS